VATSRAGMSATLDRLAEIAEHETPVASPRKLT
jgi:hypothetical protein